MNSIGRLFRVSIFGESHGPAVGIIIDGCPPGLDIKTDDFTEDLQRRKSGRPGTTPRIEDDIPLIKSGVFNDKSTGAPIMIEFLNNNARSRDYESIKNIPRPGHADFTAFKKFNGYNDYRGGGHFSGRLTLPLVAAGVIAKKVINPVTIQSEIIEAGGLQDIEAALKIASEKQDSIGGIIECRAVNIPVGWGEPFFDSVESLLSHIIFSIPAIKGIEFGKGFESAGMFGSIMNDEIINADGMTKTNNSGGINGGLTNGNDLVFRVAVKPASSISLEQFSIDMKTNQKVNLKIEGRHDLCIALRVPPVIEAVTAIVLADLKLIFESYN